jgi:acyl-coenzyme A thioesterase PaaI-like protein
MEHTNAKHDNPFCFCCGHANPMSFQLEVLSAGERAVTGHARVDHRHEGAWGALHGGAVTALFDEVLGKVAVHMGTIAATATLTVDFRAPIILPAEIEIRGWCEKLEGRKLHLRADLRSGGLVAAEAHGLWIAVSG